MNETKFRKMYLKKLEDKAMFWMNPYMWSLNFLREFKNHAIPQNHNFWIDNKPKNEEQEKIWKEFGPKK